MNSSTAFPCHAASHYDVNPVDLNESNLPDVLFQSLKNNIKPCETYNLSQRAFVFDNNSSYLFIHLNIASLQAHFNDLNEFLLKFSNPPSVIFLFETCIKTDPFININISGYAFLHYTSPFNAGDVGVYISNVITFSENQTFRFCENLWLDIEFPGRKAKYTFALILAFFRWSHSHSKLDLKSFVFIDVSLVMTTNIIGIRATIKNYDWSYVASIWIVRFL